MTWTETLHNRRKWTVLCRCLSHSDMTHGGQTNGGNGKMVLLTFAEARMLDWTQGTHRIGRYSISRSNRPVWNGF